MESASVVQRSWNATRRAPLASAVAACVLAASSAAEAQGWRKKCFDPAAAPVTIGANWQLTGAGIDPQVPLAAEMLELAKFEINESCGVRVTPGSRGVPLAVLLINNETNTALVASVTQKLIDAGAVAVVGGGNSVLAPLAVPPAVQAEIPFGVNQAGADTLSGCTAAELDDPTVVKSATPVYAPEQCWDHRGFMFRTTSTGHQSGALSARYVRETHPTLVTAAFLYRDDDFGRPNRDGFREEFASLGGTVLAERGFSIQTTTVEDFKALLREVTAGNPSIIAANPNVSRLKFLMEAYVALRDDPTWTAKPLNFDTMRFLWTSTSSGGTYGDLSPGALAALVSQSEGVQSAWDTGSLGFQKWFALYQRFKPDAQPPTVHFGMAAYDALMVAALAITAAGSTDGAAIAAKLKEVTNSPGVCVYPGEWRKAFRRLAKGKPINYQGALGPVDLDERGNATGIVHGIVRFQPDGSALIVGLFGSAAQQSACDEDDQDDDDER
jgi:ABC-type branched-subunit amino acid transport system substrate-binding protein